jgi:hypothetical protein
VLPTASTSKSTPWSTAVVETFPEGAHVTRFQTPAGVDIVVQTPWDVMVAGGVVTAAVEQR